MDAAIKSGQWTKMPGVCLAERTVGIIGLGAVGRAVAHRVAAFGPTVLAFDPVDPPQSFLDAHPGVRMTTLQELLASSHFIVLCCDLNPGALQRQRLLPESACCSCVECSWNSVASACSLLGRQVRVTSSTRTRLPPCARACFW